MWPPENSAYFPKIKHMYVIPSVEIGVQPKCHGELSSFNSPLKRVIFDTLEIAQRKLTEKPAVSTLMQDRPQNGWRKAQLLR